ncbi:MAG: hypothetical protein PHI28_05430 [Mangrovibacterium sp.]|nr:hypothetical protein [Mangrovibacterium sp.]
MIVRSPTVPVTKALSLAGTDPDHVLFEKVKTAVLHRLNQSDDDITYGLKAYLQALIKEIIQVRESNREHSFCISLADVLIAFNFNPVPVIQYMVSEIKEEVEKIETVRDKIEHLNRRQKKISQVQVKPVCGFYTQNEPASQYISKWIDAEILFYEKDLRLLTGASFPPNPPVVSPCPEKMEVNLSVAQMACLLWLFKECGVTGNSGIYKLFNFVTEHFRSKKQENISAESFKGKYYNIEESTRKEVRQVIMRMLEKVSSPIERCRKSRGS